MKTIKRIVRLQRRGSVLPSVLAMITLCLAIGTGLLALSLHARRLSIRTNNQIEATCAADAGVTKALFEMNKMLETMPWGDSTLPQVTNERLPSCDALYSYTVTGDANGGYTVECIGKSGPAGVTRRVNCSLRLQGPFESAIFVDGVMKLKPGTLVQGYNSLDPGDTEVELKIGTNSILPDSIVLSSGVVVDGDVLVGVDGDVETVIQDLGATIDNKYPASMYVPFPSIIVPELPDKLTGISIDSTTQTIGPTDSGEYDTVQLKRSTQPGILQIDGGDVVLHVTGDIGMGQDCEIVVAEGASLVLYLDGNLNADNSAGINSMNSPLAFKLYGTGDETQQLNLKAKGDFSGAVYAPDADITVYAGGDVYGSIVGQTFEFKAGGNFFYDEALNTASIDDECVRFVVERWYEQ